MKHLVDVCEFFVEKNNLYIFVDGGTCFFSLVMYVLLFLFQ